MNFATLLHSKLHKCPRSKSFATYRIDRRTKLIRLLSIYSVRCPRPVSIYILSAHPQMSPSHYSVLQLQLAHLLRYPYLYPFVVCYQTTRDQVPLLYPVNSGQNLFIFRFEFYLVSFYLQLVSTTLISANLITFNSRTLVNIMGL